MIYKKIKIAPSIIAIDYNDEEKLNRAIDELKEAKVALLHLDVMDGKFVQNQTFDYKFVEQMKNTTDFILDVHLMIEKPEEAILKYIDAGADILTIHYESTDKVEEVLKQIKAKGVLAGLSINPETDINKIAPFLTKGLVDVVLLMSVNPGACGQKFNPIVYEKLIWMEKNYPKIDVQVDGGVNLSNASMLIRAGAKILVSGSAIFGSGDVVKTIKEFRKA